MLGFGIQRRIIAPDYRAARRPVAVSPAPLDWYVEAGATPTYVRCNVYMYAQAATV